MNLSKNLLIGSALTLLLCTAWSIDANAQSVPVGRYTGTLNCSATSVGPSRPSFNQKVEIDVRQDNSIKWQRSTSTFEETGSITEVGKNFFLETNPGGNESSGQTRKFRLRGPLVVKEGSLQGNLKVESEEGQVMRTCEAVVKLPNKTASTTALIANSQQKSAPLTASTSSKSSAPQHVEPSPLTCVEDLCLDTDVSTLTNRSWKWKSTKLNLNGANALSKSAVYNSVNSCIIRESRVMKQKNAERFCELQLTANNNIAPELMAFLKEQPVVCQLAKDQTNDIDLPYGFVRIFTNSSSDGKVRVSKINRRWFFPDNEGADTTILKLREKHPDLKGDDDRREAKLSIGGSVTVVRFGNNIDYYLSLNDSWTRGMPKDCFVKENEVNVR